MVPVSWQIGALRRLASVMFCETRLRARSALEPACSKARCVSMTLVTSGGRNAEVRRINSRTWAWNLAVFIRQTSVADRSPVNGYRRPARECQQGSKRQVRAKAQSSQRKNAKELPPLCILPLRALRLGARLFVFAIPCQPAGAVCFNADPF